MKKLVFLLIVFVGFMACDKVAIEEQPLESTLINGVSVKTKQKVNICHEGEILNVSVNALGAHKKHGDALDMDGDGYFDIENPCSETDFDDNNPNISIPPSITYNGPRGTCNTKLDVTELMGVPSFIQLCQGIANQVTSFTLNTSQFNQDLNCFGGYAPITGTIIIEQNGVVVEADLVDYGYRTGYYGTGYYSTPFNIDNGPITATLISASVGDEFNCNRPY